MATLANTHRPRCCLPLGTTQALKWLPQRLGHQTLLNLPLWHVAGIANKETNPIGSLALRRGQVGRGDVRFALSHPKRSIEVRGAGCAQSGNRTKPLGLPRDGAVAFQLHSWKWAAPLEPFFIWLLLQMQRRAVSRIVLAVLTGKVRT